MNVVKEIVSRTREYGLKYVLKIIIKNRVYKPLNKFVMNISKIIFKKVKIKNTIIIESHNDFDTNGGALYRYLIDNNYNEKYKIVWLIKNKKPKKLPRNVYCFNLIKPGFRKAYNICTAKIITCDDMITEKVKNEQKVFYLTHGIGSLKNVRGKMNIPESVDYILTSSERFAPILAKQLSLEYPSSRIISVGFPCHDYLYCGKTGELGKIINKEYKKHILWMPTFRKGGGDWRNDSSMEQEMGIPLFHSVSEYEEFNNYLRKIDTVLIIKIHPMQNLSNLGIKTLSNIIVLTSETVKNLNVDNYRLIADVDALISDYSAIATEFIHLNRPVAYVFEDAEYYKSGFCVDDPEELTAGPKLYTMDDLYKFTDDVLNDKDTYENKRIKLRNWMFDYQDSDNCRRLVEFMEI